MCTHGRGQRKTWSETHNHVPQRRECHVAAPSSAAWTTALSKNGKPALSGPPANFAGHNSEERPVAWLRKPADQRARYRNDPGQSGDALPACEPLVAMST